MKKRYRSVFNTRQTMISKDYEIYYYSDLHFQSVGSHSHDYYEFYFFVEGEVFMEIEDRKYPLSPGDVILIPPSIFHQALIHDAEVPYRRFVFWIAEDLAEALLKESEDYAYVFQRSQKGDHIHHYDALSFNDLRGKLFSLLDEQSSGRYGRDTRISLCIRDLLLQINRSVYEMENPVHNNEERSFYETLTSFIDSHLEEDLSLSRLSSEFFLSRYYIAHLFQERTGLSLHQYILKKRLKACSDALRSGTAVKEAYLASGFRDYSSFFRAFKKEYGTSPSEYRQLNRSSIDE